jgi:hypothetical protein
MVSLASHYKLLGVFFIVNDGINFNSYDSQIIQCIVCHCNLIDVNVKNVCHGKNKGLVSYNKDHGIFVLNKTHIS